MPTCSHDSQQPPVDELRQVLADSGCTDSCQLRQLTRGKRPACHERINNRRAGGTGQHLGHARVIGSHGTDSMQAILRKISKYPGSIVTGMVTHLTLHRYEDEYAARPAVDDRDPSILIPAAVAEVLDVAETWLGWDGAPIYRDGNAWTPQKAMRRVADHLLDHLAEIECRLSGQPALPDQWHGRMVTVDSDFARFTEIDLDEATSRLTRLAACYQARLGPLDTHALDTRPGEDVWTIREVVHHVSNITVYAEKVGRLPSRSERRR